jgi:hypothetical protein
MQALAEWTRTHINQLRGKVQPPMGAISKEEAEAEIVAIMKEITEEAPPP